MSKFLYITPFFKYPPTDGASLRSVNLFEILCEQYDVELLTYDYDGILKFKESMKNNLKIHFLTSKFETSKSLSFFQRLFSKKLPGFASHNPISISKDINSLVEENKGYDYYYFATQLMGQSVLIKKQKGIHIIDLYDVYTTYSKNKYSKIPFWRPYYWLFRLEAYRIKLFEKKIIENFDQVLVTCKENMHSINNLCKGKSLIEVPNGVNIPTTIQEQNKALTILMVANFEYSGNNEGIKWFYKHVWQIILDKIHNAKLVLVGKCPSEIRIMTKNENNITITGIVPSLTEFYEKAACVILPLFNDGGTKTKLLEAMAYGKPIVSTREGAKGFKNMNSIIITNDPKIFASSVSSILINGIDDGTLDKSRQLIHNHYTWDKIGNKLNNLIPTIAKV